MHIVILDSDYNLENIEAYVDCPIPENQTVYYSQGLLILGNASTR